MSARGIQRPGNDISRSPAGRAAPGPESTARQTIATCQNAGVATLRKAGVENPSLDARVLLADVLKRDAAALIANADEVVSERDAACYRTLIERRAAGEPVARILGAKEFWSRTFRISPQTLVPRPETETVVEAALDCIPDRNAPLRLLDLGTGSGILLGALLLELPRATGVGVDLDFEAVRRARENIQGLGLRDRAQVLCGHWADAINARFDLVVSNPPYIASGDIGALHREVREHDPATALDGGADGLDSYRAILMNLPRLLGRGGCAVLELGVGQEPAVAEIARDAHLRVNGPARCDLSGQPRALVLRASD